MSKQLAQYLESISTKIQDEARAEMAGLEEVLDADEYQAQMAATAENITDAYAEGFCDDRAARMYGDYPYDGSMDHGDNYPDEGERC